MPPKRRSLLEASFDRAAKVKTARPKTASTAGQQVARALADNFKEFTEQNMIFITGGCIVRGCVGLGYYFTISP